MNGQKVVEDAADVIGAVFGHALSHTGEVGGDRGKNGGCGGAALFEFNGVALNTAHRLPSSTEGSLGHVLTGRDNLGCGEFRATVKDEGNLSVGRFGDVFDGFVEEERTVGVGVEEGGSGSAVVRQRRVILGSGIGVTGETGA